MIKKISLISIMIGLFLTTAAFTWPWEKKEEPIQTAEPTLKKEEKKMVGKVEVKKDETAAQVEPVFRRPTDDIPEILPAKGPVQKIQTAPVIPPVKKVAVTPKAVPKLSTDPVVVKTDLRKIVQFNKIRQAELRQQMATVNQTMQKARIYNKILTNMYPTAIGKNIAAQAVDHEKVRLLHKEVKRLDMAGVSAVPSVNAVKEAKVSADQAKRAGVLPIGKNTAKT